MKDIKTTAMWTLFENSFTNALSSVFGYDNNEALKTKKTAHVKYKEIIAKLPDFEKGDRFAINIISCAMFCAFLLSLKHLPTPEEATEFYRQGMMTKPMKWFCKVSGNSKYTKKDIEGLKRTEAFKAADRNPYSWNMDFLPYEDGSGYEARFTKCGICVLMKEYGLEKYIPAMCRLDYTMAEAGGVSKFVRQYTIASGGPYCDCGYKKIRS